MPEPRFLITAHEAAVWTGHPASTIRRWASEGRINRHGRGRGNVRFDVRELPPKSANETGRITPGRVPPRRDQDALR